MSKYDDIINLEHHVSSSRPHMSVYDRAAQFSPFAALTGYDGAIKETARLTDSRIELDETAKAEIDEKMRIVCSNISIYPKVRITYFQPDVNKDGGEYVLEENNVKKIDMYNRVIVMKDGTRIGIDDIVEIVMVGE